MSDNFKKDDEGLNDHWLSSWEQQTLDGWDSDSSLEERIQSENDKAKQKLWTSFQNSASSISRLYKEGCQGNNVSLWVPFQNSASAVTIMYRDSLEIMKKCFELGNQYGHQRRMKDMVSWTKKRKRYLRREDLVGYICGKAPPPRHKPTSSLSRTPNRGSLDRSSPRLQSPRIHTASEVSQDGSDSDDLQPFRDALALQGLNGAMSSIGIRQNSPQRQDSNANTSAGASDVDDFHYYILNEMSRRKRTAGNEHVVLDSPTRKRTRLL